MKLILSRKGFDSSAGGCPNPVFPDGTLLSLPIPDPQSPICYGDVRFRGASLGPLVQQLTRGRVTVDQGAHLDPDLQARAYPRQPGWRPLLGQHGPAQAHLARHGVGAGDLFLFFALFRDVDTDGQCWRFVPGSRPFHALWGWLQVSEVVALGEAERAPAWTGYHPHRHGQRSSRNSLYLSADELALPGTPSGLPGAGVVERMHDPLRLTAPGAARVTDWRLPQAFYPVKGAEPLSYHHNPSRWQAEDDAHCRLNSVARGQEFVLDLEHYPGVVDWLRYLVSRLVNSLIY